VIQQDTYTFNRLVIAAYRVPFTMVKRKKKAELVQNSGGLVSAMLTLSQRMEAYFKTDFAKKIVWIGYSEHSQEELAPHTDALENVDIHPVSIEPRIHRQYYNGFCNDTLWPLFHYFTSLSVFNDGYFEGYVQANQKFFDVIEKILKPDDLLWIHDYQLFLLPGMIRERFPKTNIGFFLHIPFPSYEIFRMLQPEWRERILRGMLGADLIGFHTNDYTQHFLNNVRRLLGYKTSLRTITTESRLIKADAFPLGIDYDKFNQAARMPAVKKNIAKIQSEVGDKKFIFSVDRLDYTKGILQRLLGFEYFLEKYPNWHNRVVFNMVVVPSRDTILQYRRMKREIEATVGRINGYYSSINWRPIIYQYKSLRFKELVSLYAFSQVGLITPLRDGMNLVAKEYVACTKDEAGVLILSEMAGAVAELGEAIIINPSDHKEIGEAIRKALEMDEEERTQRIRQMQSRLKTYNVFAWTNDFLNQLELTKQEQRKMEVRFINPNIERTVVQRYEDAASRAIFFDYDGTLVPFSPHPELAKPTPILIDQLRRLSEDPKNSVIISSGRQKEYLEEWFGQLQLYCLVAEHGAHIKRKGQEWQVQIEVEDEWKQSIMPLLQRYTERCSQSFVEEKSTSLAWHFRNADPDFAFVRLQELKEELQEIMMAEPFLQILEGHKVLEVKKKGYDKGAAATHLLEDRPDLDFFLAIGDDRTDEDLFKALPPEAVTIRVGSERSGAKYNLKKQGDVLTFIDKLLDTQKSIAA
jgi:trehalose 6-phosphate synthase/phosphatase